MSKIQTVRDLINRLENLPKDLPLLAGIRNSDGGFDMVDIGVSADPAGDPNIDNCLLILTPKSMNCPTGEETFPLGFGLFQVDSGRYQLQKLDDIEEIEESYNLKVQRTFESDVEAAKMVQMMADNGNEVCRRAIDFLIQNKSRSVDNFYLTRNW